MVAIIRNSNDDQTRGEIAETRPVGRTPAHILQFKRIFNPSESNEVLAVVLLLESVSVPEEIITVSNEGAA